MFGAKLQLVRRSRASVRPVFIIGCGRSGTTILGTALAQHPAVKYLHEPRNLWRAAYPISDIWTADAPACGGKLALTALDVSPLDKQRLRRAFSREMAGRSILVEKLPVNSFRLDFLQRIFPDARYLHIYRQGLEVAESIAREEVRGWFGIGNYKWQQIAALAESGKQTRGLARECRSAAERGLLEWRLSTEAVLHFLARVERNDWLELSYEELTRDPAITLEAVLKFIGADPSAAVIDFARQTIARRSARRSAAPSQRQQMIGGRILALSCEQPIRFFDAANIGK